MSCLSNAGKGGREELLHKHPGWGGAPPGNKRRRHFWEEGVDKVA